MLFLLLTNVLETTKPLSYLLDDDVIIVGNPRVSPAQTDLDTE